MYAKHKFAIVGGSMVVPLGYISAMLVTRYSYGDVHILDSLIGANFSINYYLLSENSQSLLLAEDEVDGRKLGQKVATWIPLASGLVASSPVPMLSSVSCLFLYFSYKEIVENLPKIEDKEDSVQEELKKATFLKMILVIYTFFQCIFSMVLYLRLNQMKDRLRKGALGGSGFPRSPLKP